MHLSRIRLRRIKRYPATRDVITDDFTHPTAPPRSLPHAPNFHFGSVKGAMIEGVLPSAMADYGQSNDSGYERRYASKKMHGRVEYHGQSHEYVNAVPHIPIFKRLSNPANPWDEANELSSLDPLAAVSSVNEKELAWYKKNWFKLDLIDPAKWALFPGDVVRVTNKSHPDYLKFGRIHRIYVPHGLVWVSGLNQTEPLVGIQMGSGQDRLQKPFNYRDVKYMKYGNALLGALTSPKTDTSDSTSNMVEGLDISTIRDIAKLPLRSSGASKLVKEVNNDDQVDSEDDKEQTLGERILANLADVNVDQVAKDETGYYEELKRAGLLETIDLEMHYNLDMFNPDTYHHYSWQQLGARRLDYHSKTPVELPDKMTLDVAASRMAETAPNEMDEKDFQQIHQERDADTDQRMMSYEEWWKSDEPRLWEEDARRRWGLAEDAQDFYYYRTDDRDDPDGSGAAQYENWDGYKLNP